MSNRTKIEIIAIMAILMLLVPAVSGAVVTEDVEIRGTVVSGNGTYEYDYASFAGFWYDLDKNHSSETMNVTKITGRTIAEGDLVYTCTPRMVKYKNSDLNTTYGKYKIIGFMAEKYICYDNRTDQLVKLLINWGSSSKVILTMTDPMELPEGYMLSAQEIDLQGNRVWLKLYKDGNEIDDSIVEGGNTYIYEDDDDVLLFSCKIDSVFRGTDSNLVVVKFVFLRSDTILDIDGGDTFGVMEVKGTSGSIVLKNDETITLDEDSEVDIMGEMYFKVADSTTLRYYLAKTISLVCPECPDCPELEERAPCPDCPDPEPCPDCPECPTPEPPATDMPNDDTGNGDNSLPGFGGIFTTSVLFVASYLVLKQRD